ncbi:MAG: FAD-dependent oxidoreductase [Deltaproteobacteria bacterium]|nr:FAD-dependent oxidoreductase [Deltaproteobacteria bacterium]
MKIAIIGSGIAGLGAAHALAQAGRHDIAMFEAAPRAGGHVYTVAVGDVAVDMGFIVCNRERYPLFFRLLGELGTPTRPSTMAFSVALPDRDLEWGSASLAAVFAQRRRLVDRGHWRFLVEVVRFLGRARRDLGHGRVHGSLEDYLAATGASAELRDGFVVPLAAALWSLAPDHCGDFPAETYVRFLDQHGMLRLVRPLAWHTVVGGSQRYVDALLARLATTGRFTLALATPVTAIERDATGVTLGAAGREHRFDRVVIATHADTALELLAAPTAVERRVLGAFRYSTNRTVLHTDRGFLPRSDAAHAAWNYVADPATAQVSVTYSMTRLQGLPDVPYLVTLNPRHEPANILHDVTFEHPQLDSAALAAQSEVPRLAGTHRTYYAGSYLGFGFHEDALRSGYAAAARLAADEHQPASVVSS